MFWAKNRESIAGGCVLTCISHRSRKKPSVLSAKIDVDMWPKSCLHSRKHFSKIFSINGAEPAVGGSNLPWVFNLPWVLSALYFCINISCDMLYWYYCRVIAVALQAKRRLIAGSCPGYRRFIVGLMQACCMPDCQPIEENFLQACSPLQPGIGVHWGWSVFALLLAATNTWAIGLLKGTTHGFLIDPKNTIKLARFSRMPCMSHRSRHSILR